MILLKVLQTIGTVVPVFLVLESDFPMPSQTTSSSPVIQPATTRLRPCGNDTNCVSSFYLEPPNRYISPLVSRQSPRVSFNRALRDLTKYEQARSVESVSPKQDGDAAYYIHVTVPGTAPNSLDDLELFFDQDDSSSSSDNPGSDVTTTSTVVNWRCQARVTLPPPPFCVRKNCINGNMDQRDRLSKLASFLGLPAADQSRMQVGAKWTPIFFNSDRVPDMVQDDAYD